MTPVDRAFRPLHGLPCWGVQWDAQTGLWMEFGTPRLTVYEPREGAARSERVRRMLAYRRVSVHGRWTLAVMCGCWRLKLRDQAAVTAETDDLDRVSALGYLDGQQLVSVEVAGADGATRLVFDLGAELTVDGSDCDEGEMWTLYKPRHTVLTVRSDGTYGSGSSAKGRRWLPLPREAEPRITPAEG